MTTVERREVPRPSLRARAALARLRGGLDRKSSPEVPRKHLGASRRSTVPFMREVEFAKLGRIDLRREANGGWMRAKKFHPVIAVDQYPPLSYVNL